jgi:hypothetical protein
MRGKEKCVELRLQDQTQTLSRALWPPYVLPFVVFIALTIPEHYAPEYSHLLYLVKTVSVGAMLWLWRRSYAMDIAPRLSPAGWLAAAAAGLLILPVWILPEAFLPQLGARAGFDPYSFGSPPAGVWGLIAMRLAGAVLVVPVMEEVFWRSFLLRYLVHPNFSKVPLGTFTWFSFIAVAILFGLEHQRWIQGMIAGAVYSLLVIQQKSLKGAIIAHAATNLGLGAWVIATRDWTFW